MFKVENKLPKVIPCICDARTLHNNQSTRVDTIQHGYGYGIRSGHLIRKMGGAFSHTSSINPQITQI